MLRICCLAQIQDLEEHLREKNESCMEMKLKKDEMERAMQSQELTLKELRDIIKHTEGEIEAKDSTEQQLLKVPPQSFPIRMHHH